MNDPWKVRSWRRSSVNSMCSPLGYSTHNKGPCYSDFPAARGSLNDEDDSLLHCTRTYRESAPFSSFPSEHGRFLPSVQDPHALVRASSPLDPLHWTANTCHQKIKPPKFGGLHPTYFSADCSHGNARYATTPPKGASRPQPLLPPQRRSSTVMSGSEKRLNRGTERASSTMPPLMKHCFPLTKVPFCTYTRARQ